MSAHTAHRLRGRAPSRGEPWGGSAPAARAPLGGTLPLPHPRLGTREQRRAPKGCDLLRAGVDTPRQTLEQARTAQFPQGGRHLAGAAQRIDVRAQQHAVASGRSDCRIRSRIFMRFIINQSFFSCMTITYHTSYAGRVRWQSVLSDVSRFRHHAGARSPEAVTPITITARSTARPHPRDPLTQPRRHEIEKRAQLQRHRRLPLCTRLTGNGCDSNASSTTSSVRSRSACAT